MSTPEIDVVILTHNDGHLLQLAVDSVLQSVDARVQVWVIDNGSTTPVILPSDPRVFLVRNDTNLGVGGGRNQGINLGSAPIVCVLDSDATVSPESLARLAAPLNDTSIAMTVPVFQFQSAEESAGQHPNLILKLQRGIGIRTTYATMKPKNNPAYWEVDFGIGACQLFRRSAFLAVGGIDQLDLFGPEDVDFCWRLRNAGFKIVQVRDVGVYHPARRAHRRLISKRGMRHLFAILRYYWKHPTKSRDVQG